MWTEICICPDRPLPGQTGKKWEKAKGTDGLEKVEMHGFTHF